MKPDFDVIKVLRMDVAFANDVKHAVNMLAVAAHDTAQKKGFYSEPVNVPEKLALIHQEVSEALEALRSGDPTKRDKHVPEYSEFEVELADIVIRVCDLAAYKNVPLGDVIVRKMLYNASRPHKHGKAF